MSLQETTELTGDGDSNHDQQILVSNTIGGLGQTMVTSSLNKTSEELILTNQVKKMKG